MKKTRLGYLLPFSPCGRREKEKAPVETGA
jgi:hypothetical protein